MKANIHFKSGLFLLIALFTFIHVFAGTPVKNIFANQNFNISQQQELITIDIAKSPWESFTVSVNSIDIQRNPVVNLEIQTSEPIELRVDLSDGVSVSSEYVVMKKQIDVVKNFTPVSFNFSEMMDGIDLSGDVYLLFYVNPGQDFNGEISIRNFSLNEQVMKVFESDGDFLTEGFNMFPSPASSYTMVDIPDNNYRNLIIRDINGRQVLNEDITLYIGTTFRVDLLKLPKGYYTVTLSGNNNQITEKLVVN